MLQLFDQRVNFLLQKRAERNNNGRLNKRLVYVQGREAGGGGGGSG